jgi:hypothetical protein
MMHLTLDEYSLFSVHQPEVNKSIPNDRNFINDHTKDLNMVDNEYFQNNHIELNKEYNIKSSINMDLDLSFDLNTSESLIFELVADEKYKFVSLSQGVLIHNFIDDTYSYDYNGIVPSPFEKNVPFILVNYKLLKYDEVLNT